VDISAQHTRCHVCAGPGLKRIPGYETFRRVTSDCKPWSRGGELFACQACGSVQKATDGLWRSGAENIYEAYSIYHQSRGAEQPVFEEIAGRASPRSARLLERLCSYIQLPEKGRLLDVGCGNGALLGEFSAFAPQWSLAGTELDDKYRPVVERLDRVEALYTCPPDQIPGTFNLITMVHVLEHIPQPRDFLVGLWNKLEIGGLLVIEIPDYLQNPFDLLIADHCSHFSAATLPKLIRSAGYEVMSIATEWIPKELTLVARKARTRQTNAADGATSLAAVENSVQWLERVVQTARKISTKGGLGLFGTSIAATWLFSECEGAVTFFVDEDPDRAGRSYMERPVYRPNDVPSGSHVFITLPPRFAASVRRRFARADVTYHLPPALERAPRASLPGEARDGKVAVQ